MSGARRNEQEEDFFVMRYVSLCCLMGFLCCLIFGCDVGLSRSYTTSDDWMTLSQFTATQEGREMEAVFRQTFPKMEGDVYFHNFGGADYDGDGVVELQVTAYFAPAALEVPGHLRIVRKYTVFFEAGVAINASWSVVDDGFVYAPEL